MKNKKADLTDQIVRPGGRMKKKQAVSVDDVVKARRVEIETAVREMIDTVENYVYNAAFQIVEGKDAAPGEFCFADYPFRFSHFESWQERWMGILDPDTLELQAKDEAHSKLVPYAQRFGCYLGVLIGAKIAGASREHIERIGQALAHSAINLARDRAESEAVTATDHRA